MAFGAGRDRDGMVLLLTFGTGIGSALFMDQILVPNTEFGHIEMHNGPAEHYAAGAPSLRVLFQLFRLTRAVPLRVGSDRSGGAYRVRLPRGQ